MAWLPDREVYGPERPQARDIDPLNRVFAESFTDRYRRDGMTGPIAARAVKDERHA